MMEWLMNKTATGATYLGVAVMIGFTLLVACPIAYIVVRDWVRTIKELLNQNRKER